MTLEQNVFMAQIDDDDEKTRSEEEETGARVWTLA